jgi:hypothetical protein
MWPLPPLDLLFLLEFQDRSCICTWFTRDQRATVGCDRWRPSKSSAVVKRSYNKPTHIHSCSLTTLLLYTQGSELRQQICEICTSTLGSIALIKSGLAPCRQQGRCIDGQPQLLARPRYHNADIRQDVKVANILSLSNGHIKFHSCFVHRVSLNEDNPSPTSLRDVLQMLDESRGYA